MSKVDITQVICDINKKFTAIKSELTKSDLIISISDCLEQHYICFSYNDVINKSYSKFDTIPKNKKGIYLFEGKYKTNSKNNWEYFKDKWKLVDYTPDIVYARHKEHDYSVDVYIPLYAGAATKSISERILQHVFAEKKNGFLKSTSALRLHQHIQQDAVFNLEFKVKYVEIDIAKELFPILENRIREYRNCIIGKNT